MSSDLALRVQGLAKCYSIRRPDHDHVTLAQAALHRLRHPRGGHGREEFWALQSVDFEVSRGEVLGVIGHNGAGKSTLLKVLSRITPPTKGRIEVFGRIGSLLEVGTGFHPELTGRENIYLNGSILGMRKQEISREFEAIVDFSGVEQFLDTPVKRYSSGMYVRLAFAVAAHLNTEILLLDEVLAVGDADFQSRCIRKMREVAQSGRTVLLVSHNLLTVRDLARRAILLDHGRTAFVGSVAESVEQYRSTSTPTSSDVDLRDRPRVDRSLEGQVRLENVRLVLPGDDPAVRWGSSPLLRVRLAGRASVPPVSFSLTLRDADGAAVGVCESAPIEPPAPDEVIDLELSLPPLRLQPSTYSLDVAIGNGSISSNRIGVDKVANAIALEVSGVAHDGRVIGRWWPGFGSVDLGEVAATRVGSTSGVPSA